jgi:hypothetical protein
MRGRDDRNEAFWAGLNGNVFQQAFDPKRKGPKNRFRFCTRGEAFSTDSDIDKIKSILEFCPDILFWIPTRAWRNKGLRARIESELFILPNARINASIDPTTSEKEFKGLRASGWSTMFFGNDEQRPDSYKCPKTWKHKKGHCAICRNGCFSTKRVDIHLKAH